MDAPHLYADCIKSACKTLGPAFGRDLNRDFVDNYRSLVSDHIQKNVYNVKDVEQEVKAIDDRLELLNLWDSNFIWQSDEAVIAIFEERKRDIDNENF
jgi:hypothetical protein